MTFETIDFLAALYGDRRPATDPMPGDTAADQAEPPGPDPAEALGGDGGAADPGGEPSGFDFSGWVLRPDGKGRLGWEAPDLPEASRWWAVADFDELPEPGDPCPRCGSFETWSDLLGGEHCGQCEPGKLDRSPKLMHPCTRLRRGKGSAPNIL